MNELDLLLDRVGKQGFLLHSFRVDHHGPEVVAAARDRGGLADVLVLWDDRHACAYRTATGRDLDLFSPLHVYWSYAACPVWTIRALITLPPPEHPDSPTVLMVAPPGLGIPAEGRLPVRVRKRGTSAAAKSGPGEPGPA